MLLHGTVPPRSLPKRPIAPISPDLRKAHLKRETAATAWQRVVSGSVGTYLCREASFVVEVEIQVVVDGKQDLA